MLLMSAFSALYGQSGGPDQYGYMWRDNTDPNGPVYNWIDIKSLPGVSQVLGFEDDNSIGPFSLPAPFHYYWYDVDRFWIASNGGIIFHEAELPYVFPSIPDTTDPDDFLAPMGCDLNFNGAGNYGTVWRWSNATGDTMIVTFDSVPFYDVGSFIGANTFQIILDYNDSSITFQYKDQSGMFNSNGMKSGIESLTGGIGLQVLNNVAPLPLSAVKFYYPEVVTMQVNDASIRYNDNTNSAARFIPVNGAPITISTQVINSGNTTLNPFKVTASVKNSSMTLLTTYDSTSVLAPGITELLTMPNTYTPSGSGQYIITTATTVNIDTITSNDVKVLELQVVDTTAAEIELKYEDGNYTGVGVSWPDGTGGAANYFVPPFYPCRITKLKAFIDSDFSNVGYSMLIHADDGANGLPGTLLDSVNVAGGSFTTGVFTTTVLNSPVVINSGGFYVTWQMGGIDIVLATNTIDAFAPVSRRSYELVANQYNPYRLSETEDLLIRAVMAGTTVGIKNIDASSLSIYPNPANENMIIELNDARLSDAAVISIYDLNGRVVKHENLSFQGGRTAVKTSGLKDGLYTIMIKDQNNVYTTKLSVIH